MSSSVAEAALVSDDDEVVAVVEDVEDVEDDALVLSWLSVTPGGGP